MPDPQDNPSAANVVNVASVVHDVSVPNLVHKMPRQPKPVIATQNGVIAKTARRVHRVRNSKTPRQKSPRRPLQLKRRWKTLSRGKAPKAHARAAINAVVVAVAVSEASVILSHAMVKRI